MYSTGSRIPSAAVPCVFVRDHDRHLYEHTDNLCLTNVLWRSPDAFQFWRGDLGSIAAAGAGWLLSFSLAGESNCVAAGAS